MMYIATFGPKGFVVNSNIILTFNDMQITSTLETDKQENTGKKASTYIKGAGLNTLSLNIQLDSSLGVKPLDQIKQWIKVKDSAKPYYFLLKGVPFLGAKWLLVDVKASDFNVDKLGNILAATITLSFDEFVAAGKAKKETTKSNTPKGKTSKKVSKPTKKKKNTESVYNALKPKQKSELKRDVNSYKNKALKVD